MFYKDIYILKFELKNILSIFNISIRNVGIKNLYYPIIFDNKINKLQKSIGLWNINVYLESYKRGTHMSRFINIIKFFSTKPLSIKSFYYISKILFKDLQSKLLYLQVSFIYFLEKLSPISKFKSLLNYKITLLIKRIKVYIFYILKLIIPLNNLCPCSKLISIYNAHNQRSFLNIFIKIKKNFNINKIIYIIEKESSIELWSILKRNDEKFITEFSYKNPKFVEDLIRNISCKISKINFIKFYLIKLENIESIHNHDAYSVIKN